MCTELDEDDVTLPVFTCCLLDRGMSYMQTQLLLFYYA